jgi:hypothetical protein
MSASGPKETLQTVNYSVARGLPHLHRSRSSNPPYKNSGEANRGQAISREPVVSGWGGAAERHRQFLSRRFRFEVQDGCSGSVTSSVLGSVSRAGRAPTDRRPEARSLPSARKSRAPDRCAQYAPSPCILLRSLEALWATRYALHRVSLAPAISTPQ